MENEESPLTLDEIVCLARKVTEWKVEEDKIVRLESEISEEDQRSELSHFHGLIVFYDEDVENADFIGHFRRYVGALEDKRYEIVIETLRGASAADCYYHYWTLLDDCRNPHIADFTGIRIIITANDLEVQDDIECRNRYRHQGRDMQLKEFIKRYSEYERSSEKFENYVLLAEIASVSVSEKCRNLRNAAIQEIREYLQK